MGMSLRFAYFYFMSGDPDRICSQPFTVSMKVPFSVAIAGDG
jgi:hypothetical protein